MKQSKEWRMISIQVLAVLPYPELATIIDGIQSDYPALKIHCVIGNLDEGVARAQKALRGHQYDILLSRGGTAERLRETLTNMPIFEIPISFEDIFYAVTLAKNYQKKFAVVSFPVLTDQAETLCRLTKDAIRIESIHSRRDADQKLAQLKEEGYSMIVGDVVTAQIARGYQLNVILIMSAENSIRHALNAIRQLLPIKARMARFVHFKAAQGKPLNIPGIRAGLSEKMVRYYPLRNPSGSFNAIGPIREAIVRHASTSLPTLILGESGTGKDAAATAIYQLDPKHQNAFVTIDCESVSERGWKYFFDHPNSPLYDTDNTFYFKNLQSLPNHRASHLLEQIGDAHLCARHKLIFSAVLSAADANPPVVQPLLSQLNALLLLTQPVRRRKEDLKSIVTIYISEINARHGTSVVGFEDAAESLFMQFPWPGNIPQLKRVLTELILSAKNPYIAKADVARTLQNEIFDAPQKSTYNIPLDRPLKAINQEIIQLVLNEEEMNHSRAASRLGISRTTLWRMLKDMDSNHTPDE